MTQGLHWFALTVKPRCEKIVAQSLRSRGVEEFLPSNHESRPLFPGVVFCRFESHRRRALLDVPGVLSIADRAVSETEIGRIKLIMASSLPAKPSALSRVGQRVWIERGPLAGLDGLLVRKETTLQVIVELEALNRAVAVEIGPDMVRAIEGSPHAELARLFLIA